MPSKGKILKLKGKVQHYSWGGHRFLPSLINIENREHKPFAEYWMGAHPTAPSEVEIDDNYEDLGNLINSEPNIYLGEKATKRFGELPFLLKLLDVNKMLSIQVHPTKQVAVKGFESEEEAGIPIDDFRRNYKDKNHKPEVMVALSEFWLLHGFKSEDELKTVLRNTPGFSKLLNTFTEHGYYLLYKEVMEMEQEKVDAFLRPLVTRSVSRSEISREDPEYWIKKLYKDKEVRNVDRGIFSIYFFNIVRLLPGEGIFQAANIPHAYLEGQNVELMANSDNVLRGGLTEKNVDVNELLKNILFQPVIPKILQGDVINKIEWKYPCPVDDFGLSALQLKKDEAFSSTCESAEIFIVISGVVSLNQDQAFSKGVSFFVLPGSEYEIKAETDCLLYKAYVPPIAEK